MLRFQRDLERLPVPSLSETCALYLELVRPLVTEAEFEATRRAVDAFSLPSGEGEVLQRRLLDWSATRENWLEPFWDDWYLCDDTPLLVNVSPGFVLSGANRPQVARAAGLLSAALRFKELVDSERLEPDRENGSPRCMREYPRVLGSTRIPGVARDRLDRYPDSRHVVVSRNRRFYSLEVLDEAGRPYAVGDLERALQAIADDAEAPGVPVGMLTTDARRSWARVREERFLDGPPRMQESLETIESAILLLILDDDEPPGSPRSADAARLALHGDVRGRWFDKSIQLAVAANGVSCFCMEHAGFDGRTALRFAEFLVENEERRAEATAGRHPDLVGRPLAVETTEPLLAAVERCARSADALVDRSDLVVLDFRNFGKRTVAGHGLSPDGFVQMAFQLAYFTLAGTPASTYESIDTKRFLHGRTEAMRCVSQESVAFVRSLHGTRPRTATAEQNLRAAVARHTAVVKRCREGRGVDRHLLGLRRMVEPDEPVPALHADPAYTTLSRSVLSTSSTRSSHGVELACFGPVVEEGFGLSYTIHDDAICVVVTSFRGLAGAFAEQLERCLLEMRALLL